MQSRLNTVTDSDSIRKNIKYLIVAYPLASFLLVFFPALVLLFVFSFYVNTEGGYFEPGVTIENYLRFFQTTLYIDRLIFTIYLAAVVTLLSLVLGYPLSYYLARLGSDSARQIILIVLVSSLWITYVIRAYAWGVILSRDGMLSQGLHSLGLIEEPTSFAPGFGAVVVGMIYVFLPFMILTLYSSIRNIDDELVEASKSLGGGPITTFKNVTLPLSKNGIVSGCTLVFLLSVGTYIIPEILGTPTERTHAIVIADQVIHESNVPFAAVLSLILLFVVILTLSVVAKVFNISIGDIGGKS